VLIRKPRTSAEYVEHIMWGIQEIDRLNKLVEQLLVLARFEDHAPSPTRQEVTIFSSVHEVLYRQREALSAKRITVDVADPATPPITSDPYLVDLILDNVLSNAIKYSPAGSVIAVGLAHADNRLACTIIDQGIGIRNEELDRIFDPLYRSDALAHKEIGGTGLGLSIVAKACALLAIELEVTSEVSRGTTFTLRFPADGPASR
jgi:two-component system heavy metal sensor histidine kinase CusS